MSIINGSLPRVGITGHRTQDFDKTHAGWVQEQLHHVFARLQAEHDAAELFCGMAHGTDCWAAVAAFDLDYTVHAMLPFEGEAQRSRWTADQKRLHERLLGRCETAEVFGTLPEPGDRSATRQAMLAGFEARNEAIVQRSDVLVAVWSGRRHGGTASALRFAVQYRTPVIVVAFRAAPARVFAISPVDLAARLGVDIPEAVAA